MAHSSFVAISSCSCMGSPSLLQAVPGSLSMVRMAFAASTRFSRLIMLQVHIEVAAASSRILAFWQLCRTLSCAAFECL